MSTLCWRLLTTARLSSFRLLHADWMDYGSATKTGIHPVSRARNILSHGHPPAEVGLAKYVASRTILLASSHARHSRNT
jgi:hypothetical protein